VAANIQKPNPSVMAATQNCSEGGDWSFVQAA
jgi:hypothetical protein